MSGLTVTPVEFDAGISRFDLALELWATPELVSAGLP